MHSRRSPAIAPRPHLVFAMGAGLFAVALPALRAVLRCDAMRPPAAGAATGLRGMIALHGLALPVVDLSLCMGGVAEDITRRSCVVAVGATAGAATRMLGLLAGAVHGIREIAPTPVRLRTAGDPPLDAGCVAGTATLDGRPVLALAVERLPLFDSAGAVLPPLHGAEHAAERLTTVTQVLAGLHTLVAHFDLMAARLVGAAGAGSALDLFAADDIVLALETMDASLRDAARALDALADDAAMRALCADQCDALRKALADRRARLARDIAALRPAAVEPLRDGDAAAWLRRMAAGIQRE